MREAAKEGRYVRAKEGRRRESGEVRRRKKAEKKGSPSPPHFFFFSFLSKLKFVDGSSPSANSKSRLL
jgi:hypothetical protein